MVGATATVSTFATVVGHPNNPTSAGKGGFNLGLPALPSILCNIYKYLSRRAVSSPHI
jgi:hypothetical protein